MNEEIKAQWLAALRSGEYQQGHSWLRTGDSYCCLGILCELHRKATGKGEWSKCEIFTYRVETWASSTNLPTPVSEWAEVDYHNPIIQGITLATYNDGEEGDEDDAPIRPHTFAEIADLIDRYL